jgi:hypothetical protein
MTTRLVTLASDLQAFPTWVVECTPRGWNGYHVPVATAAEFIAYMAAARTAPDAFAPDWPVPFVDAAGVLRLPAVDDADNRDADTTWAPRPDGRYELDGLVWSDPTDVEVATNVR